MKYRNIKKHEQLRIQKFKNSWNTSNKKTRVKELMFFLKELNNETQRVWWYFWNKSSKLTVITVKHPEDVRNWDYKKKWIFKISEEEKKYIFHTITKSEENSKRIALRAIIQACFHIQEFKDNERKRFFCLGKCPMYKKAYITAVQEDIANPVIIGSK